MVAFKLGDIVKGDSGRRYKIVRLDGGNAAIGLCISITKGDLYNKLNSRMNINLDCCKLEVRKQSNKPMWF